MQVIIRMWRDGYHKDIILMNEHQVRVGYTGTEAKSRHYHVHPIDATRVVIDPKMFPEADEFEVIVRRS